MKRGNCSTIGLLTAFFIMALAIPAFAAWVKIGADVRITNDANWSAFPSLVWNGTGYGVSWEDNRDGNWEIYFARIGDNTWVAPTLSEWGMIILAALLMVIMAWGMRRKNTPLPAR